jgi:signal peptidase I
MPDTPPSDGVPPFDRPPADPEPPQDSAPVPGAGDAAGASTEHQPEGIGGSPPDTASAWSSSPSDNWSPVPLPPSYDSAPPYSAWPEAATAGPLPYEEPRRSPTRAVGRHLREIAETIILALVIFLVVRAVVQNFQVEGSSMEPTLESSWYLLVNKAAYWEVNVETLSKFVPFLEPGDDPTRYIFGGPGRGDVIVFIAPDQVPGQPERDFIKRIIGLPGETVEVRDCTVFINGEPLDEPYVLEQPTSSYEPHVVPADHYFVLGDNRNNSRDSRAEDIGMIPKESIIGKAWLTYWPFGELGFVSDTSIEPGEGASGEEKSASTQGVSGCAA